MLNPEVLKCHEDLITLDTYVQQGKTMVISFTYTRYKCSIRNRTRTILVMELPRVLENLLTTLARDNNLLSWQISNDRNNNVIVKIRFSDGHIDLPSQPSHRAA